jgi:hypothetical protein
MRDPERFAADVVLAMPRQRFHGSASLVADCSQRPSNAASDRYSGYQADSADERPDAMRTAVRPHDTTVAQVSTDKSKQL